MDLNICPNCGTYIPTDDDYCGKCGTHRVLPNENYCIDKLCERYHDSSLVKPEQEYCGKCGKPTLFKIRMEKYL